MHYYRFDIASYRKDTSHLSLLEHGIYRLLLDALYLYEVPLTSDKNKLMRSLCVRTKDEKAAFYLVLEEFFSEGEKGFINDRVEMELSEIYKKSEAARVAAKIRWEKHHAKQMRTHSDCNTDGMLLKDLNTSILKDSNTKDILGDKPPATQKRFVPPSLQEATEYFIERGCNDPSQPERFIDHYKSNDWKVGKNKMKDWKASIRNWLKNSSNFGRNSPVQQNKPKSQSELDAEAWFNDDNSTNGVTHEQ